MLFRSLVAADRDADADAVLRKFPGGSFFADAPRGGGGPPPVIRVLPFRSKIDPKTAAKGWASHGDSYGGRVEMCL